MLKCVPVVIFAVLITLAAIHTINHLASLPVMYWSCSRGECVEVVVKGEKYPCSAVNLKTDKYKKVWVE